jgi:EAL and modified HD-GYP domain-containing signal transduction protein
VPTRPIETSVVADAPSSAFVGRQPLLDRDLTTIGYELLFRGGPGDALGPVEDGDAATAHVLVAAVTEFGLDQLVGDKLAFVNLTRHYLLNDELLLLLPPDRVVLEVLEDVVVCDEVVAGVERLRDRGFTIALDDFADFDGARVERRGSTGRLLDLADVVKYELGVLDTDLLGERIELDHAAGRRVVVERIETPDEYAAVAAFGPDAVQGYFFAHPTTEQMAAVTPSTLTLVRLLARINDPAATLADIVDVLTQDVSMSVKVLRFVNSAAVGLHGEVRSIRQAAVLVGLDVLRSWTNLALMGRVDDRPFELVNLALTRARFCEVLARRSRQPDPSAHYTVGLLSLLDAMTGVRMDALVAQLALDDEVRGALLGEPGPLASAVALAVDLERGRPLGAVDPASGLARTDVYDSYREAMAWASRLTRAAGEP